jgi:NAD(P)-dependent dehydrogenase (short-subunit alcohol dehydrogenase family)
MQLKLHGKLALVTGSSRGVGQQIAIGLARQGANVIIHGREMGHLSKTLEMLEEFQVEKHMVEGDLAVNADISRMTSQIIDQFGGVDILYNNAAIMSSSKSNIWKHPAEAWEKTFQVNVYALYYMCAAFIPGMIQRSYGRIINLTSGIKDQPELAPYSASKAAVDKLTRDISCKLEGTGVRINYLDPGWLKTDMGGPNAWHPVEDVLPGALIPALINDDGPNGQFFSAIDLRSAKI